jgi:hypothetical protein
LKPGGVAATELARSALAERNRAVLNVFGIEEPFRIERNSIEFVQNLTSRKIDYCQLY